MKHLIEYINENILNIFESNFSSADWDKHSYADDVIKTITGTHEQLHKLALGNKNAESFIDPKDISDEDKKMFTNVKSLEEFNNIAKKYNFTWTKIWKGPYSGYDKEVSKNKGNAFETEFIEKFSDKYKEELEQVIGKFELVAPPKADGASNSARPLSKEGKYIYAFPSKQTNKNDKFNVGNTVTDITLQTENDKFIYLSLKYGEKVTFVNAGTNNDKCFPHSAFKTNDKNKFGEIGKQLLDMFSIDEQIFIDVFNGYGQSDTKFDSKSIDVNNDIFNNFVKSVVGYGYIIVHKLGSTVHYYDLRTEKDMEEFIGKPKSATLYYGGKKGNGKRIDIEVEFEGKHNNLTLLFNIRNKQGGIYPTHIMSDYKIIHKGN